MINSRPIYHTWVIQEREGEDLPHVFDDMELFVHMAATSDKARQNNKKLTNNIQVLEMASF